VIATAGESGVVALHFEGCRFESFEVDCLTSTAQNGNGNANNNDCNADDDDGAGSSTSSYRSIKSSGSSYHPMAATPQASKRLRVRLFGHNAPLTSAAFNTTGSMLVTGAEDGMARVWCVRSRRCISTFWVPFTTIYGVQFGPTVQWKPTRHATFGPRCKVFIATILFSAMQAYKCRGLPRLPTELWLYIFEQFDSNYAPWQGSLPARPGSPAAAAEAASKVAALQLPEETVTGQVDVQERQMTRMNFARHGRR